MTTRSRHVALAASLWLAGACAGRQYDLAPVPRAGDGAAPVKVQVRHVRWARQPEESALAPGARVSIEIDLYNAGPRPVSVGMPALIARPALGGPAQAFGVEEPASPGGTLAPHESRTIWATFNAPDDESLRGPLTLTLVLPVAGQPQLEVAIAEPVPGSPQWLTPRAPYGVYIWGSASGLGVHNDIDIVEPFGVSLRTSRGRWVLGLGGSYGQVYQEALAGGPPGYGLSALAQITWQPWRWGFAPYLEGGAFVGWQPSPRAYLGKAEGLALPRVGGGLLISFGSRLGSPGAMPFARPLSPQRRLGLRLGYTRWFNIGGPAGEDGVQISLEAGFHP